MICVTFIISEWIFAPAHDLSQYTFVTELYIWIHESDTSHSIRNEQQLIGQWIKQIKKQIISRNSRKNALNSVGSWAPSRQYEKSTNFAEKQWNSASVWV